MIRYNEIQETVSTLPKNVRQIGEVQEGHRIYMEDYAYTYLHQFADKKEEQVAFLIGNRSLCDNENVLLIRGAIQGKFLKREGGNVEITEETMNNVNDMKDHYFYGEEVLGWVYTQPSYGVILTSFLVQQHEERFPDDGQVLFVLDPVEKEEVFFEAEEGELVQRQGFFVYYEKNPSMHEYMLDHKVTEEIIEEKKTDDRAVKHYRVKEQEKKEELYHRKFVNMLFILSGALVIMCIIIGAGLINNLEEMNQLKKSLNIVMADYGNFKSGDIAQTDINSNDLSQSALSQKDTNLPQGTINEIDYNTDPQVDTTQDNSQTAEQGQTLPVIETEVPKTYTVQTGDNLIQISYRFYSTKSMVPIIQEANGIKNSDKIYIGQVLILPKAQ